MPPSQAGCGHRLFAAAVGNSCCRRNQPNPAESETRLLPGECLLNLAVH